MNSLRIRKQQLAAENHLLRRVLDRDLETLQPVAARIEQGYALARVVRQNWKVILGVIGIGSASRSRWFGAFRRFFG
jgi:hypothetical protein